MDNTMKNYLSKDTTVTIRLTQEQKKKIQKKAGKRGMTTSTYMKETAMAGLERRCSRDKRRVAGMVKRQEVLNEIYVLVKKDRVQDEVREAVEKLLEEEAGLWQCL